MPVTMRIARLSPCSCGGHALVHLAEPGSDRRARMRVSLDTGRCILAEGVELPTAASRAIDALVHILRQVEMSPDALVIDRRDSRLRVRLRSATPLEGSSLDIDPDTGLLLAAQLRLPIMVTLDPSDPDSTAESVDSEPEDAHPSVHAAFRDFLATLPLDSGE